MVPLSLRPFIWNLLHESHMGINKTLIRVRELFYWPLMNADVETVIHNCLICRIRSKSNAKEPLMPHNIPNLPFNKISCDIVDHKNNSYLAIFLYLRNVGILRSLRAHHDILDLKKIKNEEDILISLLEYCNTPRKDICLTTPAQPVSNRRLRTKFKNKFKSILSNIVSLIN